MEERFRELHVLLSLHRNHRHDDDWFDEYCGCCKWWSSEDGGTWEGHLIDVLCSNGWLGTRTKEEDMSCDERADNARTNPVEPAQGGAS